MIGKPWFVLRSRRFPLSLRLDRRVPPTLLLTTLALLLLLLIGVGVGDYWIAPLDVLRTVLGFSPAQPEHAFIINTLRLPRMLVAALVGVALGVSGAIMQGVTRNPLATPDVLGVSAGAGLVAVTLTVLVPDVSSGVLSLGAFAGAAAAAGLIYVLAWSRGDESQRLILVGIGIGSVASAFTMLMITYSDVYDVQRALIWLSGSVYARSWGDVLALLPWIIVGVPLACALARQLNTLSLGEDVARGLGSAVTLQRGGLVLLAVALAGASVAAAGTIGFVGLMAPHIGRRLVGPQHEGLLPLAGVLGGLLVVAADVIGRTLFAPIELPCGVVTAVLGAPFFVYLLGRTRGGVAL